MTYLQIYRSRLPDNPKMTEDELLENIQDGIENLVIDSTDAYIEIISSIHRAAALMGSVMYEYGYTFTPDSNETAIVTAVRKIAVAHLDGRKGFDRAEIERLMPIAEDFWLHRPAKDAGDLEFGRFCARFVILATAILSTDLDVDKTIEDHFKQIYIPCNAIIAECTRTKVDPGFVYDRLFN